MISNRRISVDVRMAVFVRNVCLNEVIFFVYERSNWNIRCSDDQYCSFVIMSMSKWRLLFDEWIRNMYMSKRIYGCFL